MNVKPSYYSFIITDSHNVSVLVRLRDILLTVGLWAVYLYFIRDVLSFVTDFCDWARNGFDDLDQYGDLDIIPMIESYGKVAAAMLALYIGWAVYNMVRFRGRQRRKPRVSIGPEDLSDMYGVPVKTVESWQNASEMIMRHDSSGRLIDVKIVR